MKRANTLSTITDDLTIKVKNKFTSSNAEKTNGFISPQMSHNFTVGVRDLPEFSLRLGLTSVPQVRPEPGSLVRPAPPNGAAPFRNNLRFTCDFSSPLPWQLPVVSGGSGEITGACDWCIELGAAGAVSSATRESLAGDVGVGACEHCKMSISLSWIV